MATELQEKLASNIVRNAKRKRPLNKTQLLESSGYSVVTAKASAKLILDQKGVQEALSELGFDPDSAKRVVREILAKETAKDEVRLKAADMIFEVHGTYAPVKSLNVNVDVKPSEEAIKLAYELAAIQAGRPVGSDGATAEPMGSTAPTEERGGDTIGVREEEVSGGHI